MRVSFELTEQLAGGDAVVLAHARFIFSLVCTALLLLGFVACSDSAPQRDAPIVVTIDSTVLAIPDTMPFLNGRTQAVLRDGSHLLDFRTSVLHFARTGAFIRSLGSAGNGPGEFGRLSTIIPLPGDTLLAGMDVQRQRIVILRIPDGALSREVPMPFRFFAGQQWRIRGDTVFMPVTLDANASVLWVPATDSIHRFGSAPTLLEQSTVAYSRGGEPSLAPLDSGWLLLMPADDRLYLTDAAGHARSFVTLPHRQRRGVPSDLVEQTAALTAEANTFLASLSMGITRLSDGSFLVIHADSDFEQVGNQVVYSNTTYWASVVSSDLTRACVDAPIRFPSMDLARVVFDGDTLLLLGRRLEDDMTERATLRRFMIRAEGCRWIALGPPTSPSLMKLNAQ